MLLIHPSSFHAKEVIESLGGRWKSESKGWEMPTEAAYDAAFDACENAVKERPMERFFENDDDYSWLTAPPVYAPVHEPLPGQDPCDVKSGLVFTGHGRQESQDRQWAVLCQHSEDTLLGNAGDFLCGCLNSRLWICLSPGEIAGHPWTGEVLSLEKAQDLYSRFMES